MNRINKTIWRVPLYCIVVGELVFLLSLHVLIRLALITLPDGSISFNDTYLLIIYSLVFLVTLLVGGLVFFRNMTRKEIFYSASIVTAYGLILMFVQRVFNLTTGPIAVLSLYLFRPFEWCTLISEIFIKLEFDLNFALLCEMFTPYLFVLFGKKNN